MSQPSPSIKLGGSGYTQGMTKYGVTPSMPDDTLSMEKAAALDVFGRFKQVSAPGWRPDLITNKGTCAAPPRLGDTR